MRQQKSMANAWAGSSEAENDISIAETLKVEAEANQVQNSPEPDPELEAKMAEWSKASLEQIRCAVSKFASDRDWGEPKHLSCHCDTQPMTVVQPQAPH